MNLQKLSPEEAAKVREDWKQAVETLVQQVQTWSEAQNWKAEVVNHVLTEEEPLGTYTVPGLEIETPRGRLELEPIGRNVLGAQGRMDFYVWPTLVRVLLVRDQDSNWEVRTDFGPKWPHSWGPETFVQLAEALLDEQ